MLEIFDHEIAYEKFGYENLESVPFVKGTSIEVCDYSSDIYYHPIEIKHTSQFKRKQMMMSTLHTYDFDLEQYYLEVYQFKTNNPYQYILILIPQYRLAHFHKVVKKQRLKVKRYDCYFISVIEKILQEQFSGVVVIDDYRYLRLVLIEKNSIKYYRCIYDFNFSDLDLEILSELSWNRPCRFFGLYAHRLQRIEALIQREFI